MGKTGFTEDTILMELGKEHKMVKEKVRWDVFEETGLLFVVNKILAIFGYEIHTKEVETPKGNIVIAMPYKRTNFDNIPKNDIDEYLKICLTLQDYTHNVAKKVEENL